MIMKKILLTSISILLGISIMAQNVNTLKLNLEKNKVYRFTSSSEQTISQTVNGVQQSTNVKSNSTVSIKMMEATPAFLIAEVHFDTIMTHTNAMGRVIIINSSQEGNIKSTEMADVMTCIMNRLSKNALYIKMDFSGKVIEIVNLKMISDIIVKDTSSIEGAMASMIKMQIKNAVNENSLKSMIETITHNLPKDQNISGNKWENSVSTSSGGMSLDIKTSYNLDDVKGNSATISAESNIQAAPNAEPIDYGSAKITYGDITGLAKSAIVLDIQTGLIIESKSKTHIAGNLSLNAQGMNMEIPMDIDVEAKVVALP